MKYSFRVSINKDGENLLPADPQYMKPKTYSSGRRKMIPNRKSEIEEENNNKNGKNLGKYK